MAAAYAGQKTFSLCLVDDIAGAACLQGLEAEGK
jgi:hypothetical protein